MHRAVAEWIEGGGVGREGETTEIAAYHYLEAVGYGDDDPALAAHAFQLLLEAGEAAIARAALPSATGLFERAEALAVDARGRCLALVGLARCNMAEPRYDRGVGAPRRGERPRP